MTENPFGGPEVRSIASIDLVDHHDTVAVSPDRWPQVMVRLGFHRLTGIAVTAWESGRLELTREQSDELLERHRAAMALAIAIERLALDVTGFLGDGGVRAVVLKGSAIAHACYPDPTMRPFGDLDLLVSSSDWALADELLRSRGLTRELPEPRPGFDKRFAKGITYTDPEGCQVDLHRTLVRGPFGLWLDPEELMAATESFELAGRSLERFDRTGLLLHAILHATLGASPPLLLPLRDIVQVARGPGIDWDRLADQVSRWRLVEVVGFASASVSRELRVELPAPLAGIGALRVRRSEQRAIEAYTKRRNEAGVGIAAIRGIPGIRAKAVYVFALLVPNREFRDAWAKSHGGSLLRSRRTAVSRMVRRIRRSIRKSRHVSMEGVKTFDDR